MRKGRKVQKTKDKMPYGKKFLVTALWGSLQLVNLLVSLLPTTIIIVTINTVNFTPGTLLTVDKSAL